MINDFKGKKILVLGLGLHGGGVGTVKFLAKAGARLVVTDLRTKSELAPSIKALRGLRNIKYVWEKHRKRDLLDPDLVIKNPGVRPDSPYLRLARAKNIPITSDVEIFFKNCPAPIIGVTGTKGKSTTAYLITEFLKKGTKKKIFLGGNIRASVLEFIKKVKETDLVVLELSSFQLQDLAPSRISPPIAVFTNIYRDHLNWHKSMAEYMRAKSYIFAFQGPRDYLFANPYDKKVRKLVRRAKSRVIFPRLQNKFRSLVNKNLGAHYETSAALAIAVARLFRVPGKSIASVLRKFGGLPERQETIAVIRGVHFIDDTTSTTPEATIAALIRFGKLKKGKLILIAGGQDKNLEFRDEIRAIRHFADQTIFLPGTATNKLKKQMIDDRWQMAASMREAVEKAWGVARKGDIVLLSPGAASFGIFLNEFDRGKYFIEAVRKLKHAA